MSVRTRAVVGGVVLALAVVPSAEAAKKKPKFTLSGLKVSKSSASAGDKIRVSGKVKNRKAARKSAARVTYTLRKAKSSKKGPKLGSSKLKRTKGGKSRKFSKRVTVKSSTAARTYYVFACVRRGAKGVGKASCKKRKLTVGAAGAPAPQGPPAPVDTRNTSRKLRDAISGQSMLTHLKALQQIADEHGGTRASGYQGYGASVQYVMTQLRAAGYNPTAQVFDFVAFRERSAPTFKEISPTAKTYQHTEDPDTNEFSTMSYSASGDTSESGVPGDKTLVPVDVKLDGDHTPAGNGDGSGCSAADFGPEVDGQIALIQRGACDFAVKAVNAQNAGAVGAVIFNQGNDPGRMGVIAGTLGETAQDGKPDPEDVTIPVIGISYDEGARLANEPDPTKAQIIVDAKSDPLKSTNVIADTPTGNPDNTTIVGSHLDSVLEGPGINDNGSGSAFNLELALAMAREKIKPANRVRFAWWGAEESGLVGATRYVEAISNEAFAQIAANLNFDMLASPNHANLVYDGDFSDSPPPATAPDLNPGAAKIEKYFEEYFSSQGVFIKPTAFDGRSDYKPFQDNGVAAGGLFSGAEVAKTADEAAKWGGTAGEPFDPCYHQACDDIDNLDMAGAETLADGGADVLARLAEDPKLRETLASGGGAAPRGLTRAKRSGLGAYQGSHLSR